ncbi:MAG: polyprenyl synthetase family protein [Deltaproteobacteria bacterium]|nr:polyprenyl synthetase family protein [Deltaproteobacteria bacterium]
MPVNVRENLAARARDVDFFLGQCLKGRHIPCSLVTAMEYSLLAGGKRLRPVLCLSWAALCSLDPQQAMPFAAGIECIHTYSLIHDDLPAMDNDDLRRGRPSSHKKFDEATAILAGDGLLTEAFTLMLSCPRPPDLVLKATEAMSRAAGPRGMVGGQMLDMEWTGDRVPGKPIGMDNLRSMHTMKTGAIIRASCLCGAILAGAPKDMTSRADGYGEALGLAFQITDDILDVIGDQNSLGKPVGSDQARGKTTYPSLIGLDESRRLAADAVREALDCLEGLPTLPEVDFLSRLAKYILQRAS